MDAKTVVKILMSATDPTLAFTAPIQRLATGKVSPVTWPFMEPIIDRFDEALNRPIPIEEISKLQK